jgi:hypothetical protein
MREPRRLWRRYLTTNTVFLFRIAHQFLREHRRAMARGGPFTAAVTSPETSPARAADTTEKSKVEEPTR